MVKIPWSKVTAFFLSAIIVWLNFRYIPNAIISWDVFGYYLYLPAAFIYHDLPLNDLTALNLANEQYNLTPFYYQFMGLANGAHINIYQIGMALLYLPFFLIGHLIAQLSHFPLDGFSMPYQYAVWYGGMVYSIIGMLFLRKVLLRFFDDKTTAITLILIIIGTNYLLHSTLYASNLMTANILFTLYAAFLFYTIQWHEHHRFGQIIIIAVVGGLLILARPIELLALLIPLFWNVKSKTDFNYRWELIKSKKEQFFVFFLVLFAFLSIQLVYNKIVADDFFVSGYKSYGEDGLYLYDPHLINVLFSFRKGWLLYTPIMIFAIIGIYQFRKQKKSLFFTFVLFLSLYLYFVSSWSNWWYAAGFSQRAIIQIYPLMAIPLGFFIENVLKKKLHFRILITILFFALVGLNLFQSWQYSVGILSDSRMTSAYYFRIFGKTSTTPELQQLLLFDPNSLDETLPIDTMKYQLAKEIFDGFETDKSAFCYSGIGALSVQGDKYIMHKKIPMKEITQKDHAVLQVSFHVFPLEPIDSADIFMVIHQKHHRKAQKYRAFSVADSLLSPNVWHYITFNYVTPEIKGRTDKLEVYLVNEKEKRFIVDNQQIKVYEKIGK